MVSLSSSKSGSESVKMSTSDKDINMEITNLADGKSKCISKNATIWAGARATHGMRSGKYYYECSIESSGICRVGFSSMSAHLELGKDAHGYGYGGTGMLSNDNAFFEFTGEGSTKQVYNKGDVIGCLIDFEKKTISYSKNGKFIGKAFDIKDNMIGTVLFPAILLKGAEMTVNFGEAAFQHPPTDGYLSIQSAHDNIQHCMNA